METSLPENYMTVFVLEEIEDTYHDLISAAQSSLAFWNNPFDEEIGIMSKQGDDANYFA